MVSKLSCLPAISWALVYRTDQYKDLTRNIDAANKKSTSVPRARVVS